MLLIVNAVFLTLDMVERVNVGDVSNPGGKTMQGCFRCKQPGYGLFDSTKWPCNFLRGPIDFQKINETNPEIDIATLSREHGYNSFEYNQHQLDGIPNLHARMVVDPAHDNLNTIEQLDETIKTDFLIVCHKYNACNQL